MSNNEGETPFPLVFQTRNLWHPIYWENFSWQIQNWSKNENLISFIAVFKTVWNYWIMYWRFCQIILETNQDLVNVPLYIDELLPIHFAIYCSTVEVMQMLLLYELSPNCIYVILPEFGSVSHLAASNRTIDILKYIHNINPELILLENFHGFLTKLRFC